MLVSISVGLETGYSNWNLLWFLKYSGQILAWLLLWLQLSSPWYRISWVSWYLLCSMYSCFGRVQRFIIQIWKEHAVLPFDGHDCFFFLHSSDFNMHYHSITQLCITYSVNKHHITKNQCKLEYVYTFLYDVINIVSTQFATYFFS
jgi:hypothetical protein